MMLTPYSPGAHRREKAAHAYSVRLQAVSKRCLLSLDRRRVQAQREEILCPGAPGSLCATSPLHQRTPDAISISRSLRKSEERAI
jgi:hypothetical protein